MRRRLPIGDEVVYEAVAAHCPFQEITQLRPRKLLGCADMLYSP